MIDNPKAWKDNYSAKVIAILIMLAALSGCGLKTMGNIKPDSDLGNVAIVYTSASRLPKNNEGGIVGRVIQINGKQLGNAAQKIALDPERHQIRIKWIAMVKPTAPVADNVASVDVEASMGTFTVYGKSQESKRPYQIDITLKPGYSYVADIYSIKAPTRTWVEAPAEICLIGYKHNAAGEKLYGLDPVVSSPGYPIEHTVCGTMLPSR